MSGIEGIRAELAAATPGPWAWMGGEPKYDRYEALEGPAARVLGSEAAQAYHTCLNEADATLIAQAPTYLAALLDVAEAAAEAVTDCTLAPDTARGRRWCVAHQEWTPCPVDDLRTVLARIENL